MFITGSDYLLQSQKRQGTEGELDLKSVLISVDFIIHFNTIFDSSKEVKKS